MLACLTKRRTAFPNCRRDTQSAKIAVDAAHAAVLDFGSVEPGQYAIALLHDENGNGKPDMAVMIPTEGFGFSRNAPARFGPPSFARAAFRVDSGPVRETIRMRYMF